MCEQVRVPTNTVGNPSRGASPMIPETLHLARGPKCEPPVDHPHGGKEGRFVEGPVIVDPPPDGCVEHSGKVIEALVAASMQVPTPDFPPNRFRRLVADRRAETHEESAPLVLRPPGPERVAQKVEGCCGALPSPIAVLAVDNLRLLSVQLKPAFHKATRQSALQMVCLPLAATMADDIVGIALEPDGRVVSFHPRIEHIMQEQIGKKRTCDTPLAEPVNDFETVTITIY